MVGSVSTRKRWVTPSFDSFSTDDAPPAKKTTAKKVSFSVDATPSAPIVSTKEHSAVTWLEKYQPKDVKELVIHPKKLKEVEEWFLNLTANPYEKYLILVGPCGCGKTVSLRAIANKFDFGIIEWITPLDRDFNPDLHGDDQTYQSAAEVFEQFLCRATRYPSLLNVFKSKIILVKDFPNIFLQKPEILHDILRKYLFVNVYPVAFVCNDDSIFRNLFPESVKTECNMRTIKFNPVHCQAVIKALERVLDLEREFNPNVSMPNNIDLEAVYQSSAGDLRSAILKLYFNVNAVDEAAGEGSKNVFLNRRTAVAKKKGVSKVKKNAKNSSKDSHATESTDKDSNMDLFHMLGRVLYSSRHCPEGNDPRDYRFVHDPNELVDLSSSQPRSFVSFLQENYASRFSCIKSISRAADKLCHADILLANANSEASKETNTTALAVAIRGLMVANDKPVKSFKSFVKARRSDDILRSSFADEIRSAFPNFEDSPRDIVLYTFPLLNKSSFQFDDVQRKLIDKISGVFRK